MRFNADERARAPEEFVPGALCVITQVACATRHDEIVKRLFAAEHKLETMSPPRFKPADVRRGKAGSVPLLRRGSAANRE
jgi:hypothetical protein